MNWELVALQGYFDEGRSILVFVEKPHPSIYTFFIVKFNTESGVFINTAHLIHIAVPSFNLTLYRGDDSSFTNTVFYHRYVSRNSQKFAVECL